MSHPRYIGGLNDIRQSTISVLRRLKKMFLNVCGLRDLGRL